MSDEEHPQSTLVPSGNRGLATRSSGLVQRGLSLAHGLLSRSIPIQALSVTAIPPFVMGNRLFLSTVYIRRNEDEFSQLLREKRYAELEQKFLKEAESFKPQDLRVGRSLHNLAVLHDSQGKYAEAAALYRQAAVIFEKALGANKSEVEVSVSEAEAALSTTLSHLARLHYDQGEYTEAELLCRRPAVMKSLPGLHDLAVLLHIRGQYVEAEALYREILEVKMVPFAGLFDWVSTAMENYAALLRTTRRHEDADRLEAHAQAFQAEPSVSLRHNHYKAWLEAHVQAIHAEHSQEDPRK